MNGFPVSLTSEGAPIANPTILIDLNENKQLKKCPKCNAIKELSEFGKNITLSDKLQCYCKKCINVYNQLHKGRRSVEKVRAYNKRRKPEPKDKHKTRDKKYRLNNKEKIRAYRKAYKIKIRSTPLGKINARISQAIRMSLKDGKQGRRWEKLTGYSASDLMRHLEKHFKDGMTWERFMNREIHIDHIVPIKVFKFKTSSDYEFKKCWALKNLQPLWAKENMSKGSKLIKHYQPSLAI